MIPLNENATLQDNLFTDRHVVHQPETNFECSGDFRKIGSAFTNTTQQLEKFPPKIKFSADNTVTDHQKNATATPDLSTPNSSQQEINHLKTPDVVETAFPEKTGSQEVEDTKTTLPCQSLGLHSTFNKKTRYLLRVLSSW